MLADDVLHDGRFTGPLDSGYEDVVARAVHIEAEFDGLYRAGLTDDIIQRANGRGVFKLKHFRVKLVSEIGWLEFVFA